VANGGDYCPNCSTGHIDFTCPNHPELRWHGKNIYGRGLYFAGHKETRDGRECDCSGSLLVHVCPVDGKTYKDGKQV
jgi:hypothetical protein